MITYLNKLYKYIQVKYKERLFSNKIKYTLNVQKNIKYLIHATG